MARFNRSVPIFVLSVLFAGIMVAFAYAAADDAPATTKATTTTTAESSKPADVAADAAPLLAKLANAYKNLKTLDLAGTLSGDFDIDGEKNNQKVDVTGSYAAPNQFRHALKNELLVGSTGEQFYIFEERAKLYKTSEAKTQKVPTADLPDPFGRILLDQNLSLAFALSSDPAAELGQMYEKIAKAPDVTIDGKAHPALALSNEHGSATLALDPQTNLIRRMTIDMAKAVKQRGAQEVAQALGTMDYPTSTPGATTKPAQFAWAPPPGARDVATIQTPGEGALPALAMVGKPAPAFKLKDLNGKDVSLADLKGNVLVFDFWA
ncbi:MAG: hypothetical protein QOE14_824, partial [Humisphaera sp.]|nr:hypothetical protein [Humisphaera sp.]